MRKGLFTVILLALLLSLLTVSAMAQGLQNVELHGYAQNRLYDNPDSTGRFQLFRLSLSGVAQVGKDGTVYTEVYYHPWLPSTTNQNVYVESAYCDLPFASGRIRVGKGRGLNFGMTPSYPNRKLSEYSILQEAFTQDRITGAQYAYKKGIWDAGVTVYNDLPVETRTIGGQPGFDSNTTNGVAHIVDKDDTVFATNGTGVSGRLAGAVKLGIAKPCFQAHISGGAGELTQANADTVNGFFGLPAGGSKTHNKYGVDATYTTGSLVGEGEYYVGRFGAVKITGWSMLAGYQPKDKTRFYARYSRLNNSLPVLAAAQQTWAPRQLTLGIVQPIRKGVWAELEYEKNTEDSGGAPSIKNDLIFLELFSGF